MTKHAVFGAVLLVGCGGMDASIFDEPKADDAATTAETTAAVDPALVTDTGSSAVPDAPPQIIGTIKCGPTECNAASKSCCVAVSGGGPSCIEKGAPCAGANYRCSSTSSCAEGQMCCWSLGGAECKASCLLTEVQLCDTTADCAGEKSCKPLSGGSGYKRCE